MAHTQDIGELLFVRHEDGCVSILQSTKPKPRWLATLTRAEWLRAIVGMYEGRPDAGNGQH